MTTPKKNSDGFSEENGIAPPENVAERRDDELELWGLNDVVDEEWSDRYDSVAAASLEFEKSWTAKRERAIEETLETVPEELRLELFERLLEIDATLSAYQGVLPEERVYCERFPQWRETVKRVYATMLNDPEVAATLRVGRTVGSYSIQEIVGVGGMGVVYKARDERFCRGVALKFLSTQCGNRREEYVERFQREILLMGQTPSGSAFAQAYDCGKDGDFDYYIAMEYVDGVNLARYYRERIVDGKRETGPLPWLKAARLARDVAAGLAEIHELGVAHRDVKPENVMIDVRGRTRVLDLGLALWTEKRVARDESKDDDGEKIDDCAVVGTLAYIAPEARREPERVDPRTDLYSLGGVLLFLLTGTRPIDWHNPATPEPSETLSEFLRQREIDLPEEIEGILTRLLEADCERRYQRAVDVVADLDAVIDKWTPERRKARRRRLLTRVAAAVAFFCALFAVFFYSFVLGDWRKYDRARRYDERKMERKALDEVRNVELKWPKQSRVGFYTLRGNLYEKLARGKEDWEAAAKDYEKVLLLESGNLAMLGRVAEIYAKLGRFNEAHRSVAQGLKVAPENMRLRNVRGEIVVLQGEYGPEKDDIRFNEAIDILGENIAELEKRIKKDGDVWNRHAAEAHYWRARAYFYHSNDNLAAALYELDAALALWPEYFEALTLRGEAYGKQWESNPTDHASRAELAADDFLVAADATEKEAEKANRWNKAAKYYDRAKLWAKAFEISEKALATNYEQELGMLRRGRARFFRALEEDAPVDWRSVAVDLDGGLPSAKRFTDEPDKYWAETWAIRAWCGYQEAAHATDEEKKIRGYRDAVNAIEKALKEDDTLKYRFADETFSLDAMGSQIAMRLYDLTSDERYRKEANRYAKMEFERNRRPKERKIGVTLQ